MKNKEHNVEGQCGIEYEILYDILAPHVKNGLRCHSLLWSAGLKEYKVNIQKASLLR